MYTNSYEKEYLKLIEEGFSSKYAEYYATRIVMENHQKIYDPDYRAWAHEHGFLVSNAYAYGLDERNYKDYLSDYDYYKLWPINSWSKIWVDDKMTLKYMLYGTPYSEFMPQYYFYSTPNGLRELVDNPYPGEQSVSTLIKVLKEKKDIAGKPNNASMAYGFIHLHVDERGKIYINQKEVSENEIADFVRQNSNYIYTEYLYPENWFASVNPLIHTLRIVVVNEHGNDPRIISGYIRFSYHGLGEINVTDAADGDIDKFDYVADVDFKTGHIFNAKSIYVNKVVDTPRHPDSGVLIDHIIPKWEQLKENIYRISKYFFNCEYLGFDVGITNNGPKIMEINTNPCINSSQVFHPYYSDEWAKKWFQKKIEMKNEVTER